tara:strand:- start:4566 stop:5060 length:495 start_codon:yes stop_codon:yes gene_type:complete
MKSKGITQIKILNDLYDPVDYELDWLNVAAISESKINNHTNIVLISGEQLTALLPITYYTLTWVLNDTNVLFNLQNDVIFNRECVYNLALMHKGLYYLGCSSSIAHHDIAYINYNNIDHFNTKDRGVISITLKNGTEHDVNAEIDILFRHADFDLLFVLGRAIK